MLTTTGLDTEPELFKAVETCLAAGYVITDSNGHLITDIAIPKTTTKKKQTHLRLVVSNQRTKQHEADQT